jgi:hypothetical protein
MSGEEDVVDDLDGGVARDGFQRQESFLADEVEGEGDDPRRRGYGDFAAVQGVLRDGVHRGGPVAEDEAGRLRTIRIGNRSSSVAVNNNHTMNSVHSLW